MEEQKIFSNRFILLCFSSLLFFCSFNMIIPQLYGYLESIGGAKYEGQILFAFTMVALISRPISGKLVDAIGRVPIMIFGSLIACISALLYPLATTISLFIALRAFHGLSTGFKPTGSAAMIADIIPAKKRGEAMGYLGFMGSTGYGLGPWIGSSIFENYGYNIMFFSAALIAFLSILVIVNIKDTLPKKEKRKFSLQLIHIKPKDIIEKRVLFPSLIFFLYCLGYGTIYNLATNFGKKVFHIENIGWFFFISVAASMLSRLIAGRVSDKKGRLPVVLVGLIIFILATYILAMSNTTYQFYFGGVVFGFAVGVLSPSIYAWVTDLSNKHKKGKAFSTMYMAMEAGIGFGALFSSGFYNGNLNLIPLTLYVSSIFPLIALLLILWKWKKYINFVS